MVRFGSASGFGVATNTGITNYEFYTAIGIDYNADGLGDVLVPYSGGTWWVLLGTSSGLASPVNTSIPANAYGGARSMDYDGDGWDDLVYTDGTQIYYRPRVSGGTFGAEQTLVPNPGMTIYLPFDTSAYQYQRNPDFDGDGRDDFVYVQWYIDWYDYSYYAYSYAALSGGGTVYLGYGDFAGAFIDMNRDGLTDIVEGGGTNLWYRLSTGSTFTPYIMGPAAPGGTGIAVVDWDADGYEDVLVANTSGTWSVARSTGEGLAALVSLGAASSSYDSSVRTLSRRSGITC